MKKMLVFTNIITLAILLFVGYESLHYYNLNTENNNKCQYNLSRFDFHYKTETANAKVIMFGDSFMRAVSWDSLLNRNDVINRGISGDKIHCICDRVVYLKDNPAKICFINGGTNDLPGQSADQVLAFYKKITEDLQAQHKIPVIDLILYISARAGDKYPIRKDFMSINKDIQAVNVKLKAYAIANKVDFIDLNKDVADESKPILYDKYTLDGLHPNAACYRIWAKYIDAILKKYAI